MCTLVVAWDLFDGTPIAVAANRDEQFGRPATSPSWYGTETAILSPRDQEAGGTWIGYNEDDVLAAISNRWTDRTLASDRSRGLLTRDALREPTVESAVRTVENELREREYDAFNLLLCDPVESVLLVWDGTLGIQPFEPGVHVVMNVGYDDSFDIPTHRPEAGKRQINSARTIRSTLEPADGESVESWLDRAGMVLGDHEFGVCVHGDGFGTRSSSLIAIHDEGTPTYRFADGPPCRTPYARVETQI